MLNEILSVWEEEEARVVISSECIVNGCKTPKRMSC